MAPRLRSAKLAPEQESTSSDNEHASLLDETEKKVKQSLTLLWNDLPEWLRDNQYIHSGYRHPSNSYLKSAHSLSYIHNETVNIYSHLLGALLAIAAAVTLYTTFHPRLNHASATDILVFTAFFSGAVLCLGMSATYHTISNHSAAVAKFGNKLDYMGIVLLIWGSFIPSIYYGFARASPNLVVVYWGMITTIGAATLVVIMLPKFRSPEWRPFRAFMFCAMGLSAVVPVVHGLGLFGWAQMERQIGLRWLILQGVLYVTGAMIYAARVPERWRPGSFDIWGSSHQIFHVLVVLAAAAHLVGLLQAFDYEHSIRGGLMGAYESARNLGKPTL